MNKTLKPGWSYKKLNELGFVGRGKSKHRPRNEPSLYGGKHPFIQTAEVTASEFYIIKYSQTYSDLGLAQSKLWDKNTLCIVNAGENTAETAILKFQACFPDSIIGFIADSEKADVRFIKYYLTTIKPQLRSITKGATQDNLSVSKLLLFDILTPPLPIQRKIAGILSAYDDLIENNTRRIEILEEMARSIYREWFVKFRFPGHESVKMVNSELGPIPEGWKLKTLADFGQVITGKTPSKKIPENFGSYMPFIKTPDMHNNMFCIKVGEYLSKIGVASQRNKTIPPNSLCVSCIGTAGIVAITSVPSQTNQQINSIILQEELNREFLYFALLGLKETINQYGANGATMVNLNKSKFESLRVTSPSKNLLSNFHKVTVSNFEMIRTLQLKNLNLRKTRDLLLPRLISGEIDVENLDINTGEIAA